ncbi:iron-containing alcohol dehydrogenase [Streptomyces monashensis]|uniref:Fe-containing alcohol dehydrogenase-like C-terminal domain-containing protein n=1 Tax=Streptomyces monashensis TaxID=1678012 RepID=A0A1S2QGN2_9ACTN|nr:iron-containing alcohol dehydrogenase [Streptomyces monashensis]OIK04817.1 hypothetical protein BIV23_15805 [Streptomyces monashensis]
MSALGLVHGIGHALTAHTGTPHGVALAAVLEEGMEFSTPRAREPYERAARALGVAAPADGDWARAAVAAVRELSGALDVKRPLRALGADRSLLPAIAAGAIAAGAVAAGAVADADADAVTRNAPRLQAAGEREVLEILSRVY